MFNHALDFGVLFGLPFGPLERMCYLQYTNDLLVLTIGKIQDLKIIKLILYLFEDLSKLTINFHKTNIFSTSTDQLLASLLA